MKAIDYRIVCTVAVCITAIELYAISQGINGTVRTIILVTLAAIAGITIPSDIITKIKLTKK